MLFFLALGSFSRAQEVISSQGGIQSNSTISLEYTIGETVINTIENGSNTLTQGFHQTKWTLEVIDIYPDISVSIYPNPATEVLYIETSLYKNTIYTLSDASGRIVKEAELLSELTIVEISQFAEGGYFLVFRNDELKLDIKTHKIIKSL